MKEKKEPLLEHGGSCCGILPYSLTSPRSTSFREPIVSPCQSCDWPNLYEEAMDMNLASIIFYGLIDLRNLARENRLTNSDSAEIESLLKLPITAESIVRLVARNRSTIIEFIGEENTEAYVKAFDAIVEDESFELEFDPETGNTSLITFQVVRVEDTHQDKELVYGICVDSARKRITVTFRGCSSRRDWRISADNYLVEHTFKGTTVAMHRGFSHYLFSKNASTGETAYDSIIASLRGWLKVHPTYNIYVTGHSLGGALATVFTHRAALTAGFDGPVTCISFASPMVGNNSFEVSFKYLQRQGRIRCLRVTNNFDIFTQLPDRASYFYLIPCCWGPQMFYSYVCLSFLFFLCCQNRVYRHVGMNLRLYSQPGRYKIKHPKASSRPILCRLLNDWKKYLHHTCQRAMSLPFACFCDCCYFKVDFNKNHSIVEHMNRLEECAHELQHQYLNELYEEKRMELI